MDIRDILKGTIFVRQGYWENKRRQYESLKGNPSLSAPISFLHRYNCSTAPRISESLIIPFDTVLSICIHLNSHTTYLVAL